MSEIIKKCIEVNYKSYRSWFIENSDIFTIDELHSFYDKLHIYQDLYDKYILGIE